MRTKGWLSEAGRVLWIVGLVSVSMIAAQSVSAAEKGPIKIGIDTELSGVVSETSTNVKMGYDLALQEVGSKVAGREIKIIEYDNKTDYKVAMEVAQKLVEKDQVDILCLGSSTGAGIAIRGYTEKLKKPFVTLGMAGGEQVTLPGNRYTFRLSCADGQGELPMGKVAFEKLGFKKMVLMGPDYAGSTGKLWAFRQGFEKAGGAITQMILWPLGELDLAPYFAQIKPGSDAIFTFIPGDVSVNRFLNQYFELGLDKKIKLCTHWTMTEDYFALQTFKDKMLGIMSFGMYTLSYDKPENKKLTEAYYAKYGKKKMMNSDVAVGYDSMKFLLAALESIQGNVEDTEAFCDAMKKTKIAGVCSKEISLDENGNAVRDFLIRRVEKKNGVVQNVVLDVVPQTKQPPQGYTLMPGKGN